MKDIERDGGTYGKRTEEYKAFKARFEDLFLQRLYKYYPKTRGHVIHIELSTPLTSEHFLSAPSGASYGLEWTPAHFDQHLHAEWFDPVTKVPGLYLTGESAVYT